MKSRAARHTATLIQPPGSARYPPYAYRPAGALPTGRADDRRIVYVIDSRDRLTAFDPAFRAFAEASGAPGLPEQWLRRSLWESTGSSEINMVIRSLVGRARQGQAVTVPTRCDSPHLERFVALEIAAAGDGAVTFTATVTRARLTHAAPDHLTHMCAACFRVVDGPCCAGTTLQLEEADSSSLPSPLFRTSSPL